MIDNVWSTYCYYKKIDGHEEILENFLPYLENEDYFLSSWTYGDALSSIRSKKNDDLPWHIWFDKIKPYMEEYLDYLEPQCQFTVYSDEYWVNVYKKNNFQESHDHVFPGRSLSVIYLLEIPKGDDIGGELVLECPNFGIIKASGLNRIFNKWQYQHLMPKLESGTLIIFPSWINHYVLPNKTDERRTTIAANFCVKEHSE